MTTHQNRSKARTRPGDNPTGEMVHALRKRHGLTQAQFGELVFCSLRAVQEWEAETRRMPPITWLAFLHILGERDLPRLEAVEKVTD
jgi:DNA-binding transcriptional regulator YiaG